jgi:hypothetical protein
MVWNWEAPGSYIFIYIGSRPCALFAPSHDPNLSHHATILVFENVAVKDKVTNLRERNIEHDRCGRALT